MPPSLPFIGATNDEGIPLYVTELMETSLRQLLKQRPPSKTEICYALNVAEALNYLHIKNLLRLSIVTSAVAMCCYGDKEIDGEGKFLVTALPNSRNRRCRLVLAVLLTALPK